MDLKVGRLHIAFILKDFKESYIVKEGKVSQGDVYKNIADYTILGVENNIFGSKVLNFMIKQ